MNPQAERRQAGPAREFRLATVADRAEPVVDLGTERLEPGRLGLVGMAGVHLDRTVPGLLRPDADLVALVDGHLQDGALALDADRAAQVAHPAERKVGFDSLPVVMQP
jgi:hypothetical protein